MVNEHELRDRLSAYVAREISLASLERWLRSADLHPIVDGDDAAFRMLASVNLLVSERHDDIISADELREEFSLLLNRIVISRPIDNPSAHIDVRFSSTAQWLVLSPQSVAA
jgi:hypothetical protein